MLFDNDGAYPPLSLWFAQQLAFLESGSDPSLIGASAAEVSGESNSQGDFPSTPTIPKWHWINSQTFSVFMFAGTDQLIQAANLVAAYSQRVPNNTYPGLPTFFDDSAFRVGQLMTAAGKSPASRVFFVGHSLGGCIAQASAAAWKRGKPQDAVLSVSFGSPRTGDHRFAVSQRQNSNTRWMNIDDGVPLIPPGIPAAISYAVGLGNEVIGRWDAFEHGGGGVVIDEAGTATAGELPTRGVIPIGASIVSTLYKMMTDPTSAHSMSTYYERIRLLANRTDPPAPARVPTAPREPDRRSSTHSQNVQTQAYVHTIQQSGLVQQRGPLTIPTDRQFFKVKFEGLWWVYFGGQLICVSPTRKRAGRFCVIGNDFLRRIHRQAGVDINSFGTLFNEYLVEAAKPDNGFAPPIKLFPPT